MSEIFVREVAYEVMIEDIKEHILLDGCIIEDYPDSKPCPSALIAGIAGWRHCHAVVALCENHLRIVTVYWPEDEEWIDI